MPRIEKEEERGGGEGRRRDRGGGVRREATMLKPLGSTGCSWQVLSSEAMANTGNMREHTDTPFTTMSIEETVQLQRDKCVDVYVSSPGKLASIVYNSTLRFGNRILPSQICVQSQASHVSYGWSKVTFCRN